MNDEVYYVTQIKEQLSNSDTETNKYIHVILYHGDKMTKMRKLNFF